MKNMNSAPIPIPEKDIREYLKQIMSQLSRVAWKPEDLPDTTPTADSAGAVHVTEITRMVQYLQQSKKIGKDDLTHVIKSIEAVDGNQIVMSEDANAVINTIGYGLAVGSCVSELYEKASGLEELLNKGESSLSPTQQDEMHKKQFSASAILLFVASSYIVWKISRNYETKLKGFDVPSFPIPKIHLTKQSDAIRSTLYYFGAYISPNKGQITSNIQTLLKFTVKYFQQVIDDIQIRQKGLQYLEPFTSSIYELESNVDFTVQGFEQKKPTMIKVIEFAREKVTNMVANRELIRKSLMYAQQLCCYDPQAKKNPYQELFGGMINTAIGEGDPGCGKTMGIKITATNISDRCEQISLPFLYHPFPDDMVSKYQGETGTRAKLFFEIMQNTLDRVVYSPMDDAENNLMDRGRDDLSSGQRELGSVFLRKMDGAETVNHGNWFFQAFTNYAHMVDPASMSRFKDRTLIKGAITLEDFMDQNYLWFRKFKDKGINVPLYPDPIDYIYLSKQGLPKSFGEIYVDIDKTGINTDFKRIMEIASKDYDEETPEFIARVFELSKIEFPKIFSSRSVTSIQQSVGLRMTDFQFDEDLWEHPDKFFRQQYDRKVVMLNDMCKQNLKGKTIPQLMLEESIRYINTSIIMMGQRKNKELEDKVNEMVLYERARKQANEILSGKNEG